MTPASLTSRKVEAVRCDEKSLNILIELSEKVGKVKLCFYTLYDRISHLHDNVENIYHIGSKPVSRNVLFFILGIRDIGETLLA